MLPTRGFSLVKHSWSYLSWLSKARMSAVNETICWSITWYNLLMHTSIILLWTWSFPIENMTSVSINELLRVSPFCCSYPWTASCWILFKIVLMCSKKPGPVFSWYLYSMTICSMAPKMLYFALSSMTFDSKHWKSNSMWLRVFGMSIVLYPLEDTTL